MSDEIALIPPAPVPAVNAQQAAGHIKLSQDETAKLDLQVAAFVADLLALDIHGPEFKERVDAISSMGSAELTAAAAMSNRMLQRPLAAMGGGVFDSHSTVSKGLIDLRHTIESLDPSRQSGMFAPRKLLGLIPFGNTLRKYFAQYQSAQSHLNAIITTLYRGKDELEKDDAAIDHEKSQMWSLMQKTEQYVYLGQKLDAALSAELDELERSDPDRARTLREEVLFYGRQKVVDLLTQMAVNIQGYLALDLVKKNNLELIKGVDRATTTTVSALRTAVIVAQALANEKLVLNQITALNATTGNLIESTSQMLRQQSGTIYEQASSSTLGIEHLQAAFDNVYATMDMISDYKIKALSSLQQSADTLSTGIAKAKTQVSP
ncbi:MAG: toxic anion resistance protein [Candidatus Eremiobacteraeota bacterium]|nr:toxic anion resistance protein [Candidatus Eremiobacteraeota bacterium]